MRGRKRKRENKIVFIAEQEAGVEEMFSLLDESLARMNELLTGDREGYDIALSEDIESRINICRNKLKQQNVENLDKRVYGYDNGTVFTDLIAECEKTGPCPPFSRRIPALPTWRCSTPGST